MSPPDAYLEKADMDQRRIMELLLASTDPINHRNHLVVALTTEIFDGDGDEDSGWHEAMRLLVTELVFDTLDHAPSWLPRLFPAFAYACGDPYEGMRAAEIDWRIALGQLPRRALTSTVPGVTDDATGQAAILGQLLQAANIFCTTDRRNQILAELTGLVHKEEGDRGRGQHRAFTSLLGTVYVEVIQRAPSALPYLFPIIATLCAERRDGEIIADPDWSLALAL